MPPEGASIWDRSPCRACEGTGRERCVYCHGARKLRFGDFCPGCQGTGRLCTPCPDCEGAGEVDREEVRPPALASIW